MAILYVHFMKCQKIRVCLHLISFIVSNVKPADCATAENISNEKTGYGLPIDEGAAEGDSGEVSDWGEDNLLS